MVDFLVWLFLICVLPFVLAMFESWMKESGSAIRDESDGAGCPTPIQQETIVTGTPALTPVIYPDCLTGRWSHAGSFSGPSEGALLHSEARSPRDLAVAALRWKENKEVRRAQEFFSTIPAAITSLRMDLPELTFQDFGRRNSVGHDGRPRGRSQLDRRSNRTPFR